MRGNRGYTLLEVAVATAVMSGMFLASGTVLVSSVKSWRAAEAYAAATEGVRNAGQSISSELGTASLLGNKAMNPPVLPLALGAGSNSITFQKPLSLDGESWTNPITIRLRTEDKNANMQLDAGEDEDGNGVLDRVIELLEDLDGNGDTKGPGETRLLARGVDRLQFSLDAAQATVVVEMLTRYPRFPGSTDAVEHLHRVPVHVRN